MSCSCNDLSCDTLFDGDLICYQYQEGYRFSIDSVLLAHFLQIRKNDRILDLGTGCGIIGLIICYRWRDMIKELSAIEIQPSLARLAKKNFQANGLTTYVNIIERDIKDIKKFVKAESYDKIVCNPPFYTPTSGRISKNLEAQLARHQIQATLEDFLSAASFAVKNGGSFSCVYPADRLAEIILNASQYRLTIKKVQFIYSYPDHDAPARLVLVECIKNGGEGAVILPPFYIYCERNGEFSSTMKVLYKKKE